MRARFGIILFFLLIFISLIFLWNKSYNVQKEVANTSINATKDVHSIPSESRVFHRSHKALDYKGQNNHTNRRNLDIYYRNRAYSGAPPTIPHPLPTNWEGNIGAGKCLKCHQNGGFVPKYNAFAPVVPHPERINCRQCHVVTKVQSSFKKGSNFQKIKSPSVGSNKLLITSPPFIPHEVKTRDNCLACHAGVATPKKIRVSHPERVNCKQCHVPSNIHKDIKPFSRK